MSKVQAEDRNVLASGIDARTSRNSRRSVSRGYFYSKASVIDNRIEGTQQRRAGKSAQRSSKKCNYEHHLRS